MIDSKGKIWMIAGQSGKSGFRNGDLKNSLFNNCFGLAFFKPDIFSQLKENSSLTIILKNSSSLCLNVNASNYTSCQDNSINNSLINDTRLIKKLYLKTDEEILNLSETSYANFSSSPVLFVADKNNHCIRILDLNSRNSRTYAGVCSTPGFQDGMLGTNLFNFPESLGVDVLGNVFVYDSGNLNIRLIKPDGCVVTLVQGACRRDFRFDSIAIPGTNGLKNDVVTCYREWANSTVGDSICYSQSLQNFCYSQIFECANYISPFISNNRTS